MEFHLLLYKWIPRVPGYLLLLFFALVLLCSNGIFLGTTTDIYSSRGEQVEAYTMAYNAVYIGMGLGIMFSPKLAARFTNKALFLFGLCSLLLFNILCIVIAVPSLIVLCCFLLGFFKTLALGEIYVNWLAIWSKKMDSSRLYPFFYFLALTGSYLITWLTSLYTTHFNWQYSYLLVIVSIMISIALAIIFVEEQPLKRKIPLYQSDVLGVILISISLMSLNYLAVFGKVEDWFNSEKILLSAVFFVLFLGLFIIREQYTRRPFVDLNIYVRKNLGVGLLLFFLLGIFTPSSMQSAFSLGILKYEFITNLELNLYLIPGVLLGCIISYFWYRVKLSGEWLILAGFLLFLFYNLIMYFNLGSNFEFSDFYIPSFLRGAAFSILYISIALYSTRYADPHIILKVAGTMVIFRSFIGVGLFTGIYNYFIYAQRIRHLDVIASGSDAGANGFQSARLVEAHNAILLQQASISALKELTGILVICGIITVILLSAYFYRQYIRSETAQEVIP